MVLPCTKSSKGFKATKEKNRIAYHKDLVQNPEITHTSCQKGGYRVRKTETDHTRQQVVMKTTPKLPRMYA